MDYYGKTRTNYFHPTNLEKFQSIVGRIITDGDSAEMIESYDSDGSVSYGFCIDGSIFGLSKEGLSLEDAFDAEPDDDDYDAENVYKALQGVVPDGEALVVEEVGSEGLRYLSAFAAIVTKDRIEYVNLRRSAQDKVNEMLGEGVFDIDDEY